jgi:hypothetical protein
MLENGFFEPPKTEQQKLTSSFSFMQPPTAGQLMAPINAQQPTQIPDTPPSQIQFSQPLQQSDVQNTVQNMQTTQIPDFQFAPPLNQSDVMNTVNQQTQPTMPNLAPPLKFEDVMNTVNDQNSVSTPKLAEPLKFEDVMNTVNQVTAPETPNVNIAPPMKFEDVMGTVNKMQQSTPDINPADVNIAPPLQMSDLMSGTNTSGEQKTYEDITKGFTPQSLTPQDVKAPFDMTPSAEPKTDETSVLKEVMKGLIDFIKTGNPILLQDADSKLNTIKSFNKIIKNGYSNTIIRKTLEIS